MSAASITIGRARQVQEEWLAALSGWHGPTVARKLMMSILHQVQRVRLALEGDHVSSANRSKRMTTLFGHVVIAAAHRRLCKTAPRCWCQMSCANLWQAKAFSPTVAILRSKAWRSKFAFGN